MTTAEFRVLADPSHDELLQAVDGLITDDAAQRLADRFVTPGLTRASLRQEQDHIFGSVVVPQSLAEEDVVVYEQMDLVITPRAVVVMTTTDDQLLRAKGTPTPWSEMVRRTCSESEAQDAGRLIHKLFDAAVDRYEALAVDLELEIDDVENAFEDWSGEAIQTRLRGIRNDLLASRRNLVPLREGLRRIAEDEIDLDENRFFSRDVDIRFRDTYERVLRVNETLDSLRDYVGGVRDAHQAHVAQKQNEVMQRLTVVASILLVPTLIVGIYGQNFSDMPETHWAHGYFFSWGLILLITVGQLFYFRKRGYLGSSSSTGAKRSRLAFLKRDTANEAQETEATKGSRKT
jgi:magnesium transporter